MGDNAISRAEVTPAMIEAGIRRCGEFGLNVDDGSNEWLAEVYRAMQGAIEHPLARMVRLDEEQGLYGVTEALDRLSPNLEEPK